MVFGGRVIRYLFSLPMGWCRERVFALAELARHHHGPDVPEYLKESVGAYAEMHNHAAVGVAWVFPLSGAVYEMKAGAGEAHGESA